MEERREWREWMEWREWREGAWGREKWRGVERERRGRATSTADAERRAEQDRMRCER
jgi:hypothetical protein